MGFAVAENSRVQGLGRIHESGLRQRPDPCYPAAVNSKQARRPRRLGVYAGSFDPLTVGHQWMIQEGVRLFEDLIVSVGLNPDKKSTFSLQDRLAMVRESCRHFSNVEVTSFSNLYLMDYAKSAGASHILRGIRSAGDYEFERTMRNINGDLDPKICTVFLIPPRNIAEVSSSMVKGLIGPAGWRKIVRKYVPAAVYSQLLQLHK